MKIKKAFFGIIILIIFSCKKEEENKPKENDNFKIEGNWIQKQDFSIEYFSSNTPTGNEASGTYPDGTNYFRFLPEDVFEESYLTNEEFHVMFKGTYNLKGTNLKIELPSKPRSQAFHPWIQTGNYYVDTLTTAKLTFIDTTFFKDGSGKYIVTKFQLYK